MPEGPEVRIITEWLSKNFSGTKIVKNSKFSQINGYFINNITCKGKQIFFHLNNHLNKLYINSRLAMEGKWSITAANHTRFWIQVIKYNPIYDIINNTFDIKENIITLYNDDTRNFGAIELLDEKQYQSKLNQIGPDLLSDTIDNTLWTQKIKNKRIKNKQICDYLLEQKWFSGIGNYLKSEILYRCKIRPDRVLDQLSDDDIDNLYTISITTIKEAYIYNGLTIKTYWSPEGHRGKFPLKVYNRDIDDNGYKVIKNTFKDGRTTHWVSEIQK